MSEVMPSVMQPAWLRRARPLLGTLVDIGVPLGYGAALLAGFEAMAQVQACMSVYEPDSDVSRSHAAQVGAPVPITAMTAQVLTLCADVAQRSEGLFDVSLGSGRWQLEAVSGADHLIRLDEGTCLNLGGIAKGWAVDHAVSVMQACGVPALWVNAGGDLRAHGVTVPVWLRDESSGGARLWAQVDDGAMATSDFSSQARASVSGICRAAHISVAAPLCAVADALTKVVAQCGSLAHPVLADLLRHYEAQAWIHPARHETP